MSGRPNQCKDDGKSSATADNKVNQVKVFVEHKLFVGTISKFPNDTSMTFRAVQRTVLIVKDGILCDQSLQGTSSSGLFDAVIEKVRPRFDRKRCLGAFVLLFGFLGNN